MAETLPALPLDIMEIGERAAQFARSSRASATERAYQSDWSDFVGWCRQAGVVATLNRRVAAITAAHRMADKASMPRTRRSQTCWLASDGRMGPGRTRRNRASDKGRARSALRSERKPSIIFLRRQAVHRWGLPTGSISNFVGLPARIRVLGRLYRAPETLRGGSITVMDGRVLESRRTGPVCWRAPARPGPRSEAAAVGKVARNPRRVCQGRSGHPKWV